jgi:hypothetical protein
MDHELRTYLEAMEKRITDRMRKVETGLLDGSIVTNGTVDRHSYSLREHEQWLQDHTRAIAQHREWLQQHEAVMHEIDRTNQQIDRKLDRLAELILRGRGSNGGSAPSAEPETGL